MLRAGDDLLQRVGDDAITIAHAEGLQAHARSLEVRRQRPLRRGHGGCAGRADCPKAMPRATMRACPVNPIPRACGRT